MSPSTSSVSADEEVEALPPASPLRRIGAAASRVGRAALDRARRTPASVAFALSVLLVSVLARVGGISEEFIEARASDPGRLWTLLLGVWSTPSWHAGLALVLAFLVIGGLFEAVMGTRRWLLAFTASAAGGVLVVQAAHAILVATGSTWGDEHAARTPLIAAIFGIAGLAAAGSQWMGVLGRRRLLAYLFAALIVLAAFGGSPQGVGALGGAAIGALLGLVLVPKGRHARSLIGTRHRGRSMIALVVLTLSAGTLLAALSAHAIGPLSTAALGLDPGDLTAESLDLLCATSTDAECQKALAAVGTRGLASRLLMTMPFLLQAALAHELAKGRRSAMIGTTVLESTIAVFAFARVVADSLQFEFSNATGDLTRVVLPLSPLAHRLIPVLVPLAMVALVAWNRNWFTVRSTRRTVRRSALVAGLAPLLVGIAVVSAGAVLRNATVPDASPALLAWNFFVRLLPPSALSHLIPTLLPVTAIGHLLVEWAPLLVWAAWTVSVLLISTSGPRIDETPSAKAMEAKDFVREVGAGSLGWMLTWPGNERWLAEDGSALVTYRTASGVRLTITDPAAAPGALDAAVTAFARSASEDSMIPALYSVHADTARVARRLGWTTIRVAEEAVIDLPGLAFTGKKFQDVRTALNRAAKEGIRAEWTTFPSAPEGIRDQVRAISTAWAGDKALPEMGFTLGSLAEIDDEDTRLLLAIDEDGTVHAVTSWLPVFEEGELIGLTLDVMRRRDNSFRPVIEFLIASAALAAKDEGLQILSLSGAPLAHSGLAPADPELDSTSAQRFAPVLDSVGGFLEPVYGFRSLLFFKKKFQPRFEPLYLAVPEVLDIPAVSMAIGKAYLPELGPVDAARFAQRLMKNE